MIIQVYNVSVSSQHSSLSVNTTTSTASKSLNTAQYAAGGSSGKTTDTPNIPPDTTGTQGQNNGNNGNNGNGNNGKIGNGQLTNGNGDNNGKIGNGQLTNGNGQGQNVDNQGQSNADHFKTLLDEAKALQDNALDESINRLRNSRIPQLMGTKHHKMPTNPQELRLHFSRMIYEMLTSRFSKFKTKEHPHHEDFTGPYHQHGERNLDISMFFGGAFNLESIQRIQGVSGLRVESFEYEYEEVTYQANGVVHTADGKTITVDINMHMSREFVSFMGISSNGGMPVDPLVINYGGTAASLMGEKFLFDLTMDGNMDSLSVLAEGSGFLAIDWNGDGIINDGSELFGPTTGCGFSELRKYDSDGNGWIDENDEIFDKLVVWSRDKDGNDTVFTLKELGIGAIFLGDIATEFSFKSERNETLGVMRSTSFFLKSCGGAGTLSHIDLMLQTA